MFKILINLFMVPALILFVRKCILVQKEYMQGSINKDLEDFLQHHEHDLKDKDIQKIKVYYGLAVPVIGEMYCSLKGTTYSQTERKSLTYLGGITGLFDDFFDETGTPELHLKEMLSHPNLEMANTTREKLFLQFYLNALEKSNSTLIKNYFIEGFVAQIQSKRQTDPNLSSDEILTITKQKGGIFMLLYRAALKGEISEQENNLSFQIGLLGQLENDIFDVYKDHQDGIYTLATKSKSIHNLRTTYESCLKAVYKQIDEMDYPAANKTKFSRLFALIGTRGLVCLNQLEKLELNGVFEIEKWPRKALVCDMGKFKNIYKWFVYYLKWNSGK